MNTRMKKVLILSCTVAVLAVGGFALTRHMSSASDGGTDGKMQALFAEPSPVMLEEVRYGQATRDRTYPGTVNATREALLSFRVSGPLVKVNVQPGDLVKKGQVLMEIDARDYWDDIRVLEAQLDGARAMLENARLDYERAKPLLAEQVISQASYDGTKSVYDTAAASVKNLNASLQIAKHRLEDTRLRAPFDCIVSTKGIENHEMVTAGKTVMDVLDISSLEIETSVPESDLARERLEQGQGAAVEFASLPGRRFPAKLKEWSTSPDPATRTYSVTFAFSSPGEVQILPGMTGELFWERKVGAVNGISVPVSALVSDGDNGSAVWVYDPQTSLPSRRAVRTGGLLGKDRVAVTEGLNPGERVVTAGAAFVTEGMKLRPMESK
jgi:RND family efflux transporter MFP subunit